MPRTIVRFEMRPSRYSGPPSAMTELVAMMVLSRSKNAACITP